MDLYPIAWYIVTGVSIVVAIHIAKDMISDYFEGWDF